MLMNATLVDAVALFARYDDNGQLYTIVVKKEEIQIVKERPIKLIDQQLRKNGSSLRGAKDAADYLMGTTSRHPYLLQTYPDIHVWFPSEATRNELCAYFCVHQIINFRADSNSEDTTIVYLQGKYALIIPVSEQKFAQRYNEAYRFLGKAYKNRDFAVDPIYSGEKQMIQCAEIHADYIV